MAAGTLSPQQVRSTRKALKARVSRALGKELDPRQMGYFRRATSDRTATVDGFHYTDEAGEHSFYPHDPKGIQRVGLYVTYRSLTLWRSGDHDEANKVARQMNYYLAYALTKAGLTVTVVVNSQTDPGLVLIWADENREV